MAAEWGPAVSRCDDGITSVRWSPDGHHLAVSSWDGTLRVVHAADGVEVDAFRLSGPVLCAEWAHGWVAAGTAGAGVVLCDPTSGSRSLLGHHDAPVSAVGPLPGSALVYSASWDATLALWDPRLPDGSRCVARAALPGKCFSASAGPDRIVAATWSLGVSVYRAQDLSAGRVHAPEAQRSSKAKSQTREVRCDPKGAGYALAAVDGKVSVEYFDSEGRRPFAFKCHRDKRPDGEATVHPVNAVAFHPMATFATGGCDGAVHVWDPHHQKRIHSFPVLPAPVASLDVSPDGTAVAVAASYTYELGEMGERDAPAEHRVFVMPVTGREFHPR